MTWVGLIDMHTQEKLRTACSSAWTELEVSYDYMTTKWTTENIYSY